MKAKKGKSHIQKRIKTWDETHKGKSKVKVTMAGLGTPVGLIFEKQKPIKY
jgi:hypothetical protein